MRTRLAFRASSHWGSLAGHLDNEIHADTMMGPSRPDDIRRLTNPGNDSSCRYLCMCQWAHRTVPLLLGRTRPVPEEPEARGRRKLSTK